jgi:TonB-linked SusC/RagA family outer membrane protein
MGKNYRQLFKKLCSYSVYGMLIQCFVFVSVAFGAKQQQLTVSGRVIAAGDESGLPGVNVIIKGTTLGTTTDADGKYVVQVPDDGATLVFSFIGYKTQEISVSSQSTIDVTLESDAQQLDEVVVVGYGTQQRVTLTGAVADVKGDEMRRTKNENPQNMLTGRIAGVRVWQRSAEPGTFNNSVDIRGLGGAPLVVIDGVPRTVADFQRLNSADIDNISVLKDASAAIYGVRAASGVILVTTKKGTAGKATISYNGSFTFQKPSQLPTLADPYQTMTLYNERSMNNINGGTIVYDDSYFEAFRSGARRSTDWTKLIFSDFSPQTQHDLSLTGGTDKTQYYVAMGYQYQEGFFKSGDLNYKKYNVRTNITSEIATGLTFNLNLSGIADMRHTPYSSAVDIIRNYWRQGVLFPAYADPEGTMLNYEGLDLEENTVAKMTSDISGYHSYAQKYLQSSATLTYDFGTVSSALQGLTAKALISYDYRNDDNKHFRREYYQYSYNPVTGSYDAKLYAASSPSQMRREFYGKTQMLGQFILNYSRVFGKHHVTGLLGLESQSRKGDNFYAQRNLAFATDYLSSGVDDDQIGGMSSNLADVYNYANSATFGRINYTFADRYIIEGQFRYDGSSKFVPGHQWGFFPSTSVGWRLSEEPFFKSIDALSFITQLKFRGSYGITSNDGDFNYDWVNGYIYPATGDNAAGGYYNHYAPGYVFNGGFSYGVATRALANRGITWWTANTIDVGMDFEAWNGKFGFSADYFERHRNGLFAPRVGDLPTVVGATAPNENLDTDMNYGVDLEINHRNTIGGFNYSVKAIATVTRQKWGVAVEKSAYGNSYDKWRNDNLTDRFQGVQFGYESAGRYTSWEDIWSYPIFKERDILPGDYKYLDWNGDGEINGLDEHPFAYDQTPWVNFSLGFNGAYKSFDLNFLFQGTALGSMQYREPLYAIWGTNGGGTLTQYLDRWHPVDPTADPYNPATEWVSGYYGYTGRYPKENSDFNRVSTAYLRLKSVEVGYTLPKKIRALQALNLRVFVNAYNMFTITKVKFVDPEHPDDDLGRMYPLNKTLTVGVSAKL